MRLGSLMAAAALLFAASANAQASVYNFTIDSANYNIAGQVTANGNVVTSISGTVTGLLNAPIIGLDPYITDPIIIAFFPPDNTFQFVPPFVSFDGVLFDADDFAFNIYSLQNGSGFDYFISTNQFGTDYFNQPLYNPGSLITGGSISAVPELSTWALVILGFASLGVADLFRTSRKGRVWSQRPAPGQTQIRGAN